MTSALAAPHPFAGRWIANVAQSTIVADGVAHPAPNGFALTAAWRGGHALETVATKNGEVVGRGEYTVSADGRHLTIAASDQVIVLDRAEPLTAVK